MTTFLEKLQKGMKTEKQDEPELEEIPQEEPAVEEKPIKKKSPKKRMKKEKMTDKEDKKKKETEFKKIGVKEEPAFVLRTSAAITGVPGGSEEQKGSVKEKKWLEPEGQLTVDVFQTDKEFVVQSAIAGVQAKDLDISIDNDMLIIRGMRKKPFEEEKEIARNYSYQECFWGPFSRQIVLPEEIDCFRIQASMKEGILTIRIPKIPKIQRRTNAKITIGV